MAQSLDRFCVWIVSPDGYVHSHAFDEAADAIAGGIVDLGGSAPVVRDPSRFGRRTPLVLGANLLRGRAAEQIPRESVILNLEQVDHASQWFTEAYVALLRRHTVLDYSPRNAAALVRAGIARPRVLGLGYTDGLRRIRPAASPDIDVLFYGSVNPRRRAVLEELARRGLRVEVAVGTYGRERDALVARSKVVLNLHYYASSIFEAVRVTYLMANGACVVTEGDLTDPDVVPFAAGLTVAHVDELADACTALVADEARRRAQSAAATATMQARPQSELWAQLFTADDQVAGPRRATPTAAASTASTVPDAPLGDVHEVVFVCPTDDDGGAGAGAEAMHQVAAALREIGVDGRIAYVSATAPLQRQGLDLVTAAGEPDTARTAFARYGNASVSRLTFRRDRLVVLPPSLAHLAPQMAPWRTAVWWYTVDDALAAGAPLTDEEVAGAVFGDRGIAHLHQSAYAREFVRACGRLSWPLGDHVAEPALGPDAAAGLTAVRSGVAFHEGGQRRLAQGFFDAEPDFAPIPVAGLSPERAAVSLRGAEVYVDFGDLPGRDRTPRLAALAGAVILVQRKGAGCSLEDFPMPDLYRFDLADVRTGALAAKVHQILALPDEHRAAQAALRQSIRAERDTLRADALRLFGRRA